MQIKRRNNGFTLIELMLVIAVMAAMVTMGITAYRQKMQNAKIDQAVLQIQNWLQAGLAYRLNDAKGNWPNTQQLVENNYVKNFSNPWRTCISMPQANQCFEAGEAPPEPPGLPTHNFQVKMKIPNPSDSSFKAVDIANIIVQRLPNAKVDSADGDIRVIAEVPLPLATTASNEAVIIRDIKFVSNAEGDKGDPSVMNPDVKLIPEKDIVCPNDRVGKRFYSLTDMDVNLNSRPGLARFWGAKTTVAETDTEAKISPELKLTSDLWPIVPPQFRGKVMVIDACLPKSQKITVASPGKSDIFHKIKPSF